ncbi:hypothetical protein [Pseudoruegeria sp. SHC-113]|uniref:hypothetical protein n=1 Tax=Pseudoruegeria sp. SHC-113 TaxID=2855439 RepID=UPI0021BAC3EE|nr:hypothetical protein [Pseudoruegeria sp. SHC-113]MCT8159627.1 hypothetical protein [Pseudoruegeria sp. SHC-113]
MSDLGAGRAWLGNLQRVAAAFVCVSLALLTVSAVALSPVLWAEVPYAVVLDAAR